MGGVPPKGRIHDQTDTTSESLGCCSRFPGRVRAFEPAGRLFPRFGASSTRSLAFAPRSEPPRGCAPGAQTIWMRSGNFSPPGTSTRTYTPRFARRTILLIAHALAAEWHTLEAKCTIDHRSAGLFGRVLPRSVWGQDEAMLPLPPGTLHLHPPPDLVLTRNSHSAGAPSPKRRYVSRWSLSSTTIKPAAPVACTPLRRSWGHYSNPVQKIVCPPPGAAGFIVVLLEDYSKDPAATKSWTAAPRRCAGVPPRTIPAHEAGYRRDGGDDDEARSRGTQGR
eukprot:gene5487-biopygen1165